MRHLHVVFLGKLSEANKGCQRGRERIQFEKAMCMCMRSVTFRMSLLLVRCALAFFISISQITQIKACKYVWHNECVGQSEQRFGAAGRAGRQRLVPALVADRQPARRLVVG